ncbi:hypothetical protein CLAIMM_11979 [Cladophialophora immunda]|nr:hypothetical protein CLAIMM_11979 [Cladophialophora immunda]
MAPFPSESRPHDVVLDENDGDEALTDSRFAAGSPELSFYSDAHNLRVWSTNGNDAHKVLPISSTKLGRTAARKRTADEKKSLFAVAQLDSTLASAAKIYFLDVIAPKDPLRSRLRPSTHHDDHEPNNPVHMDEQRHHRSWATSQRGHFEDLVRHAIENHEINPKANDVNDNHIIRDEEQDTTRQRTGQLPPIVDKPLSTSTSDFPSERSPKATHRDPTKELSSRSNTSNPHWSIPALHFSDFTMAEEELYTSFRGRRCLGDRIATVIEFVCFAIQWKYNY